MDIEWRPVDEQQANQQTDTTTLDVIWVTSEVQGSHEQFGHSPKELPMIALEGPWQNLPMLTTADKLNSNYDKKNIHKGA